LPVTLIGGGVPGFPYTLCCDTAEVAVFDDEDEIATTDRYGIRDDAGFAVNLLVSYVASLQEISELLRSLPRNASAAADLVEENILSIVR